MAADASRLYGYVELHDCQRPPQPLQIPPQLVACPPEFPEQTTLMQSALLRRLKYFAKLLLGVAIVGYLIYQAQSHQRFEEIWHNEKDWAMLAASLGCVAAAVLLSIFRWYLLVQAVDLPFTLWDAFRLGSLGFALNFIGPGGVGGDLFKSVAIAREHPNRKSQAVATVITDRLIGLTSLLLTTSTAILATGLLWDPSFHAGIRSLAALAVGGLVAILVVGGLFMAPGRTGESALRVVKSLPLVGRVAGNMFVACQMISRRPDLLISSIGFGVSVHILLVFSFHAVALGLPLDHPPLIQHFCIVPLAETAGAVPLTPGGLGATEAALAALYSSVGADHNSGLIVALVQRIVMLSVGVLAIMFYYTHRESTRSIMQEAEEAMDRQTAEP